MTITLHWWYVPIALIVSAIIVAGKQRGDYDFSGGILAMGLFACAIAFTIGHFI